MSNNSFLFADELAINSGLRRKFAQFCQEHFLTGLAEEYEEQIEQHGAEDLVQEALSLAPEAMWNTFRIR